MTLALVDRLRALPAEDRQRILGSFSARQLAALRYAWRGFWARPDEREPGASEGRGQVPPPGEWTWWCCIGGRAGGKTRACAEWVHEQAMTQGRGLVIHLVGQTIEDAQETMVEGESGLLATAPPWAGLDWKVSKGGGTLRWRSGARARVFGADKPSKGRGPQCSLLWLDDPAAWGPHGKAVLDQLLFGFRRRKPDGSQPQGAVSSTPIDSEVLRFFLESTDGARKSRVVFSRSTTDENRANLASSFFDETLAEFAGTELEQQERFGLADLSSSRKTFAGVRFDAAPVRITTAPLGDIIAIAVWVDPALSTSTRACEVGLVVSGLTRAGHVIALEDRSRVMSAELWPDVVLDAVEAWSGVAPVHAGTEVNRGGNMPEALIRSAEKVRRLQAGMPGVSILEIRTAFADRNKGQRAAPLGRLYRAGQLHHVPGLVELERQLRALDETNAPNRDRADAWVYSVLDLALGAYAVGGTEQGLVLPFAPAPLGSISVGAMPSVQHEARTQPFQFGVPAGWR